MAEKFLLVNDDTKIVEVVTIGRATMDGHTAYAMPSGLEVGVGWLRTGGTFVPPPIPDAPSTPSDADRLSDLERRVTALDSTDPAT